MMKFLSRLKTGKILLPQLLLVFIAFSVMALLGSYFGSRIVNKYIANYGDEVLNANAETIKTYLKGYEITLNDIAFVLQWLHEYNSSPETMCEELSKWSDWLYVNDERFDDIIVLYGVVDGSFINTYGWEHPDDFVPESRVWYTGACALNGGVYYCDPYVDAYSDEYVTTLSKQVFDKNGKPYGVIALDVFISSISDFLSGMQLLGSGYGVLLDSSQRIIVHPVTDLFGVRLANIDNGRGYAEMAETLSAGEDVSAFNFTSVFGDNYVAFIKKLFNGWYIGISLPGEVYYNDVQVMRVILFVTGLVMALVLCVVLTFMHIAKNRSDTASRVKSSFLANMSHEIRTPMNAVIGMAELLLHEPLNERQRDYVNDIISSTHALLSIVNDILDLSKIESGKLSANLVNYDFQAMIDNINSMFKYVAQKKGLEFKFETIGEIPRILYGDDIRLRQVLTNLCGNAVKYTEKGYIRFKVTISGKMLIFEIKDTGMGISKEAMPKLFNAFEQDKSDKNRSIVGTGLGLAISKAFVEMMDGKIMIDSEEGQGTIVTLMVPFELGSESDVENEKIVRAEPVIYAPDARILLVDDNEFNLKVAHGLLKLFGIDAKTAASGKDAIGMIKVNEFDIVFMDHMMPDMDGVETTCEIRKLGGKYKCLPIIAFTANAVHGAKEMFLANGFNGFISKPIEMHSLVGILMEWLPQGKITQKTGVEATVDPEKIIQNAFWDALDKIGDINSSIGLRHASGVESIFHDNLVLFHKKFISEFERMSTYLDDIDIENFSISIHTMKSILATIGAIKLSEAASKIEAASKNKDLLYCIDRFPYFKERLLTLHKELSDILLTTDEPVLEKESGEAAFLQEHIQNALAAADDYDNGAGLDAVNRLLEYDFGEERNNLLENALTAFREYDCDRAMEFLKQISQGFS
jgi:signal transduction histidine kinase/HPt (histidine-containing phosphotransfer) domain-containing protein/ActR/RegA family two-component response regulator